MSWPSVGNHLNIMTENCEQWLECPDKCLQWMELNLLTISTNKPLQIEDSQLSSCSSHSPGCSSDPRIGACATNIKQESYHTWVMSSENSRHWVIPSRRFRPKFDVELRNIFQLDVTCCMALLGSQHLPQGQDLLLRLPQLRLPLLPLTLLLLRAQTLHETTTELLLFLF